MVHILTPLLLATIAIGFSAALIAWHERSGPGVLPLLGMLIGQVLWSVTLFFQIQASSFIRKLFWEQVTWIGIVIIPVAWLLFALEYTGRDKYIRLKYISLLGIIPAVTVVLALTSQYHQLLYTETKFVEFQGRQFLFRQPGPWFWVITAYTYLLGALGSIPLLDFVQSKVSTFQLQSISLLIGTVAPWASNALFLMDLIPIPALDPTPIMFSISGVAYLFAVTQFRLFGTTPSASQHARKLLIDQIQEGAIVVDSHDFVVDINESAGRVLGVDRRTALGKPAQDIVPKFEMISDGTDDRHHIQCEHTGKLHDITKTEIVDTRDRPVGTILMLRDISDYIRNQQRHKVLNRLFRHNIRTKTNLIISHSELLEEGNPGADPTLIKKSALNIAETAEQTRKVIDLFKQHQNTTSYEELSIIIDNSAHRVRNQYPKISIDVDSIAGSIHVNDVLETVIFHTLNNAAAHNDNPEPYIQVAIDREDGEVTIEISDNGPGISEYERSVIERGTEDKLRHGSGLGLWLIKWGTEIAGGDIKFKHSSGSGTTITITVPIRSTAEDHATKKSINN